VTFGGYPKPVNQRESVSAAEIPGMVRTRHSQQDRFAERAEALRLEIVRRGFLPAQSSWFFRYPDVQENMYSKHHPATIPIPSRMVYVPIKDGIPQLDVVLWEGCTHSCEHECPRCRVTGPFQLDKDQSRPRCSRIVCCLWNHVRVMGGEDNVVCPRRPDPHTGKYGLTTCLR
jgi:hypothetical protein